MENITNIEREELLREPAGTSAYRALTNGAESDIIQSQQSELGTFKKKLRSDNRIDDSYYSIIKDRFSHGSGTAKTAFNKYVPTNSVKDSNYSGIPCYDPKTNKIYMSYLGDLYNPRGAGVTWFHEHGHMVDVLAGRISNNPSFTKALKEDFSAYLNNYSKKNGLDTVEKVYNAIGEDLMEMRYHSSVSDILNALSEDGIRGISMHERSYWSDDSVICSEAFAHMFEAQFDEVRYKEMKKYFPTALKEFENILGGAIK